MTLPFAGVGNTPMVSLYDDDLSNIELFAKLEFYNSTGSVKDRAAHYIIQKLFTTKQINSETTIIESSSGNFGVALSAFCTKNKLKFICVIDPNISPVNEMLINAYGGIIEKVTEADSNGGYLITRIRRVKELNASIKNSYWINQYNNRYNAEAYYLTLGKEICDEVPNIEYVFIGVSSGGTLTGVSNMIKRRYPSAKVIAVDIEGSVIFNTPPKKRLIPGIGSSIVPNILKHAKIDDVVIVDEAESIEGCHSLLNKNQIFAGGSSGAVLAAMKKYFRDKKINRKVKVVTIMADRGERYTNTIYNKDWYSLYFNLPEPIKQKTADIII